MIRTRKQERPNARPDEFLDVLRQFGPEEGPEIAKRGHRGITARQEMVQKRIELSTAALLNATTKRMCSKTIETYKLIDEGKENVIWVDSMHANDWTG